MWGAHALEKGRGGGRGPCGPGALLGLGRVGGRGGACAKRLGEGGCLRGDSFFEAERERTSERAREAGDPPPSMPHSLSPPPPRAQTHPTHTTRHNTPPRHHDLHPAHVRAGVHGACMSGGGARAWGERKGAESRERRPALAPTRPPALCCLPLPRRRREWIRPAAAAPCLGTPPWAGPICGPAPGMVMLAVRPARPRPAEALGGGQGKTKNFWPAAAAGGGGRANSGPGAPGPAPTPRAAQACHPS